MRFGKTTPFLVKHQMKLKKKIPKEKQNGGMSYVSVRKSKKNESLRDFFFFLEKPNKHFYIFGN